MYYLFAIVLVVHSIVPTSLSPITASYYWSPRNLTCEYYGGNNTRCVLNLPEEQVDRNPGCFEELDKKNNLRVYCGVGCEESDETTILKKISESQHNCNLFYTYNLERRRTDWYLWRSGICLNTTIAFEVSCGTQTDKRKFYFQNEQLFEYEDAE